MWFCAWVLRAIWILDKVLEKFPWEEIFLNHDIVHNNFINEKYTKLWIIIENNLLKIPKNSIIVLSAHWTS